MGAAPLRPCPSPGATVCSRAIPKTDTSLATAVSMASVTLAPDTAKKVVEVLKSKKRVELQYACEESFTLHATLCKLGPIVQSPALGRSWEGMGVGRLCVHRQTYSCCTVVMLEALNLSTCKQTTPYTHHRLTLVLSTFVHRYSTGAVRCSLPSDLCWKTTA